MNRINRTSSPKDLEISTIQREGGNCRTGRYYHAECGSVEYISTSTLVYTSSCKTFEKGTLLHSENDESNAQEDDSDKRSLHGRSVQIKLGTELSPDTNWGALCD